MNAFVQHIDAEEKLQMFRTVRHKSRKRLAGLRITGIGPVYMRIPIDHAKPFLNMGLHFIHMLLGGAKNDILPGSIGHVLGEDLFQSLGFLQRTLQKLQILFALVPDDLISGIFHSVPELFKTLLITIECCYICRGLQYSPDDGFSQSHMACNVAIKKLIRHVPLIIEIPNIGSRKA